MTPELAAKLAKRLEAQPEEESEQQANEQRANIPQPPLIPQKIVPNPYVANDETFSVDELLLKALNKKKEEENNNELSVGAREGLKVATSPTGSSSQSSSSLPSSVVQSTSLSPSSSLTSPVLPSLPTTNGSSSLPRTPPPKTSIRELLEKEYAHSDNPTVPTSKVPLVPIQYHNHNAFSNTPLKQFPRLEDEQAKSELEKRLAAQRAKREIDETDVHSSTVAVQKEPTTTNSTQPSLSVSGFPKGNLLYSNVDTLSQESTATNAPPPLPKLLQKIEPPKEDPRISPIRESSKEPSEERRLKEEKEEQSNFEQLELSIQKAMSKSPTNVSSSPPILAPPPIPQKTKTIAIVDLATDQASLARSENGPHTQVQGTSAKMPDSPAATKKSSSVLSPLGLMCDPLLSVQGHSTPVGSPIVKKAPVQLPKPENKKNSEEELTEMLDRRAKILEGDSVPQKLNQKLPLYAEFPEFSRKQIKFFTDTFKKFDEDSDGYIDFMELKRMMEKLGEPQTHIALKQILTKVDEDKDGKISLREFFLLFRLAVKGELGCSEIFQQLADSVDVAKEGVLGAASFFQAKIEEQTKLSKFEEEIKTEQEERKKLEAERQESKKRFMESKSLFK